MTRTNLDLHRQIQSLTDTFEFLDTAHGLERAIEFITHPCENQKVQWSQWPDEVRAAALGWLNKQYEAFKNQPIYLLKTQSITKFNKHTDFIVTTRKEWALKHDIVDLDRAFLNLPDGFIATANPEEAKLTAIRLRKKKIIKKRVRNDLIKKIDHHSVQLPAERLLQAMALAFPNKCLLDKIEIFEDRTVENNAFFNEWPIHVQQRAQAILKDRYESFLDEIVYVFNETSYLEFPTELESENDLYFQFRICTRSQCMYDLNFASNSDFEYMCSNAQVTTDPEEAKQIAFRLLQEKVIKEHIFHRIIGAILQHQAQTIYYPQVPVTGKRLDE